MSTTDHDRYLAAAHAMQSGVAAEHGLGGNDGTPKHLRVGITCCQFPSRGRPTYGPGATP